MNRRTLLSAAAAAILAAGSFSASAAPLKELKIAATPVPQGEVLKFVKPILAKEGIDLKIIEFTDYIAPNAALDAKEVDVNFYQHQPFLDNAVRQRHINAVRVAPIYILPMAVYSQKLKSLKNVPNGACVSIPNDPSNGGRALLLLQSAGLIKLRSGVGYEATPIDVVSNPKKLKFVEIEAPQLPRALPDVAAAAVNGTYARPAGLSIAKQGVLVESAKGSAYANVLVVRTADKNKPWVKTFIKAYHQPNVKAFIEKRFGDSTFPAW